jgi:hypothetical protein
MRNCAWLSAVLIPAAVLLFLPPAAGRAREDAAAITWKKTVIDRTFRSEGVTVADVNRDGKMDVLNGEMWYEAPDWKPHPIRKLGNYGDGLAGYSNSFACWAEDINGDGYPDLIVIGFPGAPCHWFENPKGGSGLWKEHEIWHSACNETPQYADLFGTGKRVLIMGWQPKDRGPNVNEGQMAYFTPGSDPTQLWVMHPISPPTHFGNPAVPGTFKFSHGLGVGDVNGDGRLDVICTGGWWEQPAKVTDEPWVFHPAALGPDCADMFTYDMNGDGKADILSSAAHKFGIWWHEQKAGKDGPTFVRHDLFPDMFSESHAMHFEDVNGDGLKDLITGKRFWSHGRNEPGSNKAAVIYWFEAKKGSDGLTSFKPHQIDDDSGIGTQFYVGDVNGDGLLDVVTSNKKGTYLFEQVRAGK